MEFIDGNRIKVDPPKKPKKLTGTRFATILGLNAWSTPFEIWCAVTRTYEAPFEDTVYTKAGKVIEPKVIEYLDKVMFMDLKSPTDVYGPNYFKLTWGDFFPKDKVLGGMWDALGDDFVVEIKTTKRAEDWAEDVPIYYKLQAALYAYLLGFEKIVMTASFLDDMDYNAPEKFVPSYKNTKVYEFELHEAFPNFELDYVKPALDWWRDHVETGISPEFDEKRDAEILKVLRKNTIEPEDKDITKMIAEADRLQVSIDKAEAKLKEKKDRLKEIDTAVKKYMTGQFRDGDTKVELTGKKFTWTLSRTTKTIVDSAKLKKDGLYDQYTKTSEALTLKKSLIEEDKK